MKTTKLKHALIVFVLGLVVAVGCSNNPSKEELGKEIVLKCIPSHENPQKREWNFIQLKDASILFVCTNFIFLK